MLRALPAINDPNVLVATATADDAGVYKLSDDLALVQTVDFFTPIVDDPRVFGRIAATNALSDVYAMGGRPLVALAIAAFPEENFPLAYAREIVAGGAEKAREAGVSIIGGHTIKDPEPKYGLAVTGVVHPQRVVRNSTGRPGDMLVITKPLGTGILTTARRRDEIADEDLSAAISSMTTLNRGAAEAMIAVGVSAATDVTGFGFVGHLMEMCSGSGVGARIDVEAVPLFDGVVSLAQRGCVPGGSLDNYRNALQTGVKFGDAVPETLRLCLCDAQTSGGLLIAVPEDSLQTLLDELAARSVEDASVVGQLTKTRSVEIG